MKIIKIDRIMDENEIENRETLEILNRKLKVLEDNRDSMLLSLTPVLNDLHQVKYEIDMINNYLEM